MTDANTAALADFERKTDHDEKLWAMYGKQAQANCLERLLSEHPEKLLAFIEDHGITCMFAGDALFKHRRDAFSATLAAAIKDRDDCDFGSNIIDAACIHYTRCHFDSDSAEVWGEIYALDASS